MTAQHSDWAPSSMGRILSCPASAELVKLYRQGDSEASNLGTIAHGVLESSLIFGVPVEHEDIEIVEGVELAVEYVEQELLKGGDLYVEQRLAIAGTPVWGTSDVVIVHPKYIKIVDYKHGYLPVNVAKNVQLMSYLKGAIEEYGERNEYYIAIIQPRYDHIDGPIREYKVTAEDLAEYDERLQWALANTGHFAAGSHCKYCPARGACRVFAAYLAPRVSEAIYYDLSDRHTFSDETLASLLDMSDLLPGWISELRSEAIRRTFADRTVPGYKLVNGKSDRDWSEEARTALPVLYEELGIPQQALWEAKFVSPATAEKQVKATFKGLGRGKWKEPWERIDRLITRKRGIPALVRDIDGRPKFRRGTEFGELIYDDTDDGGLL